MLFTSFEFLVGFLPVTFAFFFALARIDRRLAAWWLAAASLFFYGWWDVRYVPLLLASIVFNYAVGYILSAGKSKMLLAAGVTCNLALLGVFKYADFFIRSANEWGGTSIPLLHFVLPLGISFFSFTQIAFLVDAYRGKAHERNFAYYVLFVTYFPHLIAGPVLHHSQMMPQFRRDRVYTVSAENLTVGLGLFAIGLGKKLLIADPISAFADPVFSSAHAGVSLSSGVAWAGALAYTFQLYFDFSGYSDMAVGLSRLFGVQLPINFNSPYKAMNISEFWRRWHMTLSQFLRDYLYIPLGGNRSGAARRYVNLSITMVLGGLWHGANWTYVIWGALHGALLCVHHLWSALRSRIGLQRDFGVFGTLMATGLTFVSVVAGWVFFRADSLQAATGMLRAMAIPHGPAGWSAVMPTLSKIEFVARLLSAAAIVWLLPNAYQFFERAHQDGLMRLRTAALAFVSRFPVLLGVAFSVIAVVSVVSQFGTRVSSPFLYFQF